MSTTILDQKGPQNPIIEIYRGKKIFKYNNVVIRVSREEFKKFIDRKEDDKISIRSAIREGLLCGSDKSYTKSGQCKINPVMENYRGYEIRMYNRICIRLNQYEIKKFIDMREDFSLSVRQAIQEKNLLCNCTGPIIQHNTIRHGKSA